MPLLKIKGKGPRFTINLEHPIRLKDDRQYRLALVSFLSENYTYNVLEPASIYFWDSDIYLVRKPFEITSGHWTIRMLSEKINGYINSLKLNVPIDGFSINKTTDRISITSPLKFYLDDKAATLLGYSSPGNKSFTVVESFYNANEPIIAINPPNLRAVDAIEIHCNIAEHSYINHNSHSHKHAETEMLYSFFLNVAHGYKIYETPVERLYVNLKSGLRAIDCVEITLRDQNNRLLQNGDVENIVILDLSIQPKPLMV